METIAVIGSNMVDLVTYVSRMPVRGETLEAPNFELGCGGKGANQAVAAARLGARVVMVTKVGDDVFADNTIRNFEREGIDTTHVRKVAGVPSGVAPIFVEPDSSNSILIVKGANRHLQPADIDAAAPMLAECALIVLQLEIELDTVYHAIEFGARHGIPVLLNPAPAVADLDFERIRSVEFFVPNETELAIVSGMPVDSRERATRAAEALVARGLKHVLVTLGSNGSLLVYTSNGSLLGVVPSTTNRQPMPLAHMSPWLPKATIAIEDRRFWQHGGLDYQGIARAVPIRP